MHVVVRVAAIVIVTLLALAAVVWWMVLPPDRLEGGTGFQELSGPYLGQRPPGETAERFAPTILQEELHTAVAFSPDGQEAYWRPMGGDVDNIVFTRLEGNGWTVPQIVPFASRFFDSDDPCIAPDGNRLFFTSWRPPAWYRVFNWRERIWYVE